MKVVGIALVVVLISGLISFSCSQEHDSQGPHVRVRRGFGCPFNQGACHGHCRSIRRRGGYCSGFAKQTCTCYRK
ncbi:4 kDa defensin-like [Ixodes scapularis]|uniref:4 kDa defensin-like n=1 Tax=Ixodes scapularis TaxID=6945 RepID=UPI001A9EBE97|nr:4 kDa defensin-like [Ixodes scapularis]